MDTALTCSCKKVPSLKMVITGHAYRASASTIRIEKMKKSPDKAMASPTNCWKRIGAMRKFVGEAETRIVQLMKECDS